MGEENVPAKANKIVIEVFSQTLKIQIGHKADEVKCLLG